MAPRGGAREPKALFELGKKGRKTGIDLLDTGKRDEHGMMPTDGIFSSPARSNAAATPNGNRDQTGEQDMEMDSAGPGPTTVLRHQHLPRGRSPAKTNLQSPAVRKPRLGLPSSPTRGSIVRQPDDEEDDEEGESLELENDRPLSSKPRLNGTRPMGVKNTKTNGNARAAATEEEEEESILQGHADDGEDSMQLINESLQALDDSEEEQPEEDQEEEDDVRPVRKRARPKKDSVRSSGGRRREEEVDDTDADAEINVRSRRRGGPGKNGQVNQSKKRARPTVASSDQRGIEDDEGAESLRSKRHKTSAKAPLKAPAIGRGKQGRRAPAADPDTSLAEVTRGPPLPRSRGLVSIHRNASDLQTTRSGRHSIKPVEYWRGERVEFEMRTEGNEDVFRRDGRKMILPTIKEVIRIEKEEVKVKSSKRGTKPKANTAKKRARSSSPGLGYGLGGPPDEDELEEWERVPGRLAGEVVVWDNHDEWSPPAPGDEAEVMSDNIAVSAAGVVTKDIKDATFKFAKTMNTPFMGTGIVDLPPGAEKKTKNSRKMQMAFFVFFGKVVVTVHETEFVISTGGHWFVPRGNYYSIRNDYDTPARIFFAQACEILVSPLEEEEEEEEDVESQ